MTVFQKLYGVLSKSFKYKGIRAAKRKLRPLKWAIFGKEGIYQVIDLVKDFKRKKGKGEILTVFDIGAADGEFSLTFLNSFPGATVYCFEPQTRSFEKLRKKVEPFQSRAKPFQLGFYNRNGGMTFHLMTMPDSSSLLPLPPGTQKIVGTETVKMRRLDDFVAENGIERIDFMKIDVESVEKEMIQGSAETLANKVDNLYVEVSILRGGKYSRDYLEVLKLIDAAGFTLVGVMTTGDASDFFFSKLV